jgi:hypothetical protein
MKINDFSQLILKILAMYKYIFYQLISSNVKVQNF